VACWDSVVARRIWLLWAYATGTTFGVIPEERTNKRKESDRVSSTYNPMHQQTHSKHDYTNSGELRTQMPSTCTPSSTPCRLPVLPSWLVPSQRSYVRRQDCHGRSRFAWVCWCQLSQISPSHRWYARELLRNRSHGLNVDEQLSSTSLSVIQIP
jgi:hypothetical protein